MSFFLALTLFAGAPPSVGDVSKVTLSPPTAIVEFDAGKLKGDLWRLAWSPDEKQVYLQTLDITRGGPEYHHYVLALDGQPPKTIDQEPAWFGSYWMWKSGQAAPGLPDFKIAIEQRQQRVVSTSTPNGGDMARGSPSADASTRGSSSGISMEEARDAAYQSQTSKNVVLRLKGETIAEFLNTIPNPGSSFGWAPAGSGIIAFVNHNGRLVLMDDTGRKQEVAATKDASFPAFTDSGKRIAYLEKTGRKKYSLKVIDVGQK